MGNQDRRIARVEITPELLARALITGATTNVICIEGVPEDAAFVGTSIDPYSLKIMLFFTHRTFGVIREGMIVPVIPVTVEEQSR